MSCEVKLFGKIRDLRKVQELLGFSQDDGWLNYVYYSASPTGEVLAFGHGAKLVILTTEWSKDKQAPEYTIFWEGELENPNEIITALLCIPVHEGLGTNQAVDWTCVAVGVSSGLVLFYSDSGFPVFTQRWHEEPVQGLKAQLIHNREEIHLNYISCVCIIQIVQLLPVLTGLKEKLGRNVNNLTNLSKTNLSHLPVSVPCRKWEYRMKSGTVNDAAIIGQPSFGNFDHLLDHSLEKGFYAKPRSSPVQQSVVVGVGVKPFVGFYYAKEGYVPADLTYVAKAVANKVKSTIPWLFKSNTGPTQEEVQQTQPGEPMSCRFGICDIQREANNVWLAPGNKLAVVTDNLSRVILVDCLRGVALRVWKGYRDAQCAFIKTKEKVLKSERSDRRKALFLVIYAPTRCVLEIWALQHGPKVAAFNVSKNGQLIYNTHGLMGIGSNTNIKFSVKSCLFLDPADESLKEITVPFHCALISDDSKTAKDVYLFRRIKLLLRDRIEETNVDLTNKDQQRETKIATLCSELQTNEIRQQCIQFLANDNRVTAELFESALLAVQQTMHKDVTSEHPFESDGFTLLLENYLKLTRFYLYMKNSSSSSSTPEVPETLRENDLDLVLKVFLMYGEDDCTCTYSCPICNKDCSKTPIECGFITYLSVFTIDKEQIQLNTQKIEVYKQVGYALFRHFQDSINTKGDKMELFMESAADSGIFSEDLMTLYLHFWLMPYLCSSKGCFKQKLSQLYKVALSICILAGDKIKYEYNAICPWWQQVRELILESDFAPGAFYAAIVCRSISQYMLKRNSSDDNLEDENWEKVSQEAAQWSLLIGKLEDVAVLAATVRVRFIESRTMPYLNYEDRKFSLKSIILGGKGIVAERVAKWFGASGIHPARLLEKEDTEEAKEAEEEERFDKQLRILRQHFPFSLQSGILLIELAWEYMCLFSKDQTMENYVYFRAALTCLQTIQPKDYDLKHGMCCMIWNTHLKIPLEESTRNPNASASVPYSAIRDLQEIDPNYNAEHFRNRSFYFGCKEFFKHFASSVEFEKRELRFEEILVDGPVPLSQLALQQNKAIKEMIELHIELCTVLYLLDSLTVKYPKPLSTLFDSMSNQTFFMDINRELPYKLPSPDLNLQKHRQEFLCKAVSKSVDLIGDDPAGIYLQEHTNYMTTIKELADMWELDSYGYWDNVKKHEIVELYAHGWDAYAEELLEDIVDREDMGRLLLEIAGRRLSLYTSKRQGAYMQVANMGPLVLSYLDSLKVKKGGVQIHGDSDSLDLDRLCLMAAKAFMCLSEKGQETKQLRIAGQLHDACCMLKACMELGHLKD